VQTAARFRFLVVIMSPAKEEVSFSFCVENTSPSFFLMINSFSIPGKEKLISKMAIEMLKTSDCRLDNVVETVKVLKTNSAKIRAYEVANRVTTLGNQEKPKTL
jgi:hypothetical protein